MLGWIIKEAIEMAGYPIGYQGTMGMGFETQTMKGVRGLANALLIFIVVGVLTLVISLSTAFLLNEFFASGGGVTAGSLTAALGTAAVGCGILVLALAGLIIALIGLYSMHKGRSEYGPAHEKNVRATTIFLVVAIVVYCLGIFIGVADAVASIDFTNQSEMRYAPSTLATATSGITGIVSAIMIALILYYLVKSFIPLEKMNMASLAILLYAVASIGTMIGSLTLAPPADFYLQPGTVQFDITWIVPSIISGIIGTLALLLFYLLYRDVSTRLRNRTIKPAWETAAISATQVAEQRWQPPPKF